MAADIRALAVVVIAAIAAVFLTGMPSHAAKKKSARCTAGAICSVCKGKTCQPRNCAPDGKWYASLIVPVCTPAKCTGRCA